MTTFCPVAFTIPGGTPDVCMTVFSKEFHAESSILRANSRFFRRFLINPRPSENSRFDYDYVSKVDDDGTWGLQPKHTIPASNHGLDGDEHTAGSLASTKIDVSRELRGFESLCEILYSRQYQASNFDDLECLVRLADFYGALPTVSRSIKASMISLFSDFELLSVNCLLALKLGYQLRSPLLFREAFVHVVGKYCRLNRRHFTNKGFSGRTQSLVEKHVDRLRESVDKIGQYLFSRINKGGDQRDLTQYCPCLGPAMNASLKKWNYHEDRKKEAHYYRSLYESEFSPTRAQCKEYQSQSWRRSASPVEITLAEASQALANSTATLVRRKISPLMTNNLVCCASQSVGVGPVKYFLCAKISDEELPWDLKETDW
ncbi:MAG: hypothetical protein M1812_005075 [Candelaria pacifica]|nr:MAG: hypothetical protein M1812_005075 [Candelaria pacifica]